uniref:RAWUL domain-containing protein n=1 Tax=Heterorhabditis bacteriophora TaxID=37862 RepID=A0A1I7WR70_HETBA
MESFKPPILQAAQGSSLKDMDLRCILMTTRNYLLKFYVYEKTFSVRKHCKKGNLRMTPISHMITSASVNKLLRKKKRKSRECYRKVTLRSLTDLVLIESNPRPELGNIITMKLSETIEDGLADNQMCKMKVETFFQVDILLLYKTSDNVPFQYLFCYLLKYSLEKKRKKHKIYLYDDFLFTYLISND